MTTPLRLVLFVDAQNTYMGARRAFFPADSPSVNGQVNPWRLGEIIAKRSKPADAPCVLHGVRMYTGRPDPRKAPKAHSAHMQQCKAWEAAGAQVIWRGLRYPPQWPDDKAEEKGIDVALAIDFVTMGISEAYDVGVIMSTDNDLLPAIEFVRARDEVRQVAVAAWGDLGRRRYSLAQPGLWCHWLDRADYDAVKDPTRYAR